MMLRKFFLFLVASFAFFSGCSVALAQEATGIQVQPAVIEEAVDPGDEYAFSVRVTNIGSAPKTLYMSVLDIEGLSPQGVPIFAREGAEKTAFEVSSWVALQDEPITIEGGETREVFFSVLVPADAEPGSHFGGIFFTSRPLVPDTIGSAVGLQVGSILSLRISGEIIEEAFLREFTTGQFVYEEADVVFTVRVGNVGNVLIRPHGILEITDMFGKNAATISVNENAAAVFPASEREFRASWQDLERFTVGRYEAVLTLSYGEEGRKSMYGTLSFWIIPVKLLGAAFGSILAFILFVFIAIRMHIRRKVNEMGRLSAERFGRYAEIGPHHYRRAGVPSRLAIFAVIFLLFTIIALGVLFFLFA